VKSAHDSFMDLALEEAFHGGPDVALADRIIAAAKAPKALAAEATAEATAQAAAQAPAVRATAGRRLPQTVRRWGMRRWVEAACVMAALAVLAALVFTGRPEPEVPQGVQVAEDAKFDLLPQDVLGPQGHPALQVNDGWYVVSTGAPAVIQGEHRVEMVEGKVVIKVGEIPTQSELAAKLPWLNEHQVENVMLNNKWVRVGGFAVLIAMGTALVDGNTLHAEEKDGNAVVERPAAKVEQLKKEIAELEKKAERVNGMEEGEQKTNYKARVENALKEKRAQLAELEAKIAEGRGDKKEGEADRERAAKEREARAAKERKEREGKEGDIAAERKRRAAAEAEEKRRRDAEAKERKEREAKEREAKERREGERKREGDAKPKERQGDAPRKS